MAGTTVPSSGSLHGVTVGEVLGGLAEAGVTGLVRFDGDAPRLVALAAGRIYLATGAVGPSIHQIVVGSGAAPEDAWSAAGAAAGPDGISAVLDDDERVDSERLRTVLFEHVVSTVVELLAPGTDRYEVVPDQLHQLGSRFSFEVEEVLVEASRRLEAWRALSATLPSTTTLVRRAPVLPARTTSESVTAVEWQVLSAVGEDTTVAQLIADSGLGAFTVYDVLHGLLRRGLLVADPAS